MEPILTIVLFFAVLAFFLGLACCSSSKKARSIGAVVAFGWAGLIFMAANVVQSFNLNAWYSGAAHDLLESSVAGIERGDADRVSKELATMRDELSVTYENRGNFKELAIAATEQIRSKSQNVEVASASD